MGDRDHENVEANEVAFFADFFHEGSYNPTAWRLRLNREVKCLRRAAAGHGLGRVLSIGCGDGQFELLLARHADDVTALDLSAEAIAAAERKKAEANVENVHFRRASLAELEWDEMYDTIVCIAFLHHVPPAELPILLEQAHAHLTPGGVFYSQDPNVWGFLRTVGHIVLGKKYDTYHSPDERELDPAELVTLLRDAGFARIQIGYNDLTLHPAQYVMPTSPGWLRYPCVPIDWIWCHSPLARWASGFTACARKAAT